MRGDEGSASLLTILLLPLMVLSFAVVIDLGVLRLAAARARAAADLAALVAVNDQTEPSAGAALRLAVDAELVAREYFELNLAGSRAFLAASVTEIARSADIAAFPAGGVDPLDGSRYEQPTVRIDAAVPLRSASLAPWIGPAVVVRAFAVAAAR